MARVAAPLAALALVLALCCEGWAGPPTETLDEVLMRVNLLLDDPALQKNPPQLLAAIRQAVIERFDVRQAARLALGREWDARTSTERDEFVQLFGGLIENAYVSRIASRANIRGGLTVRYVNESVEGDRATVTATIEGREGDEIPLVYRMIQHGQRWAVYDVLIDGISLVVNYRAQLLRTIHRSSYAELVAMLKARVWRTPTVATAAAEAPAPGPAARPASRVEVGSAPAHKVVSVDRGQGVIEIASTQVVTASSYWLQLGAFPNQAAGELASRLLEQSLPLAIDAVPTPAGSRGQPLLRVRVGPFSERADAAAKLRDLQTKGYQPLLAHEHD